MDVIISLNWEFVVWCWLIDLGYRMEFGFNYLIMEYGKLMLIN